VQKSPIKATIFLKYNSFVHRQKSNSSHNLTGWRRLIGCLKLHVIFRTRASHLKALLRKMTYVDKASYDSTPPCTEISSFFSLKRGGEGKKGKKELSWCSHWGDMTLHATSQESTSVQGITGISTSFSFAKKTGGKKKGNQDPVSPPPKKGTVLL